MFLPDKKVKGRNMDRKDWNGNGHRDSFDDYMDYKISNSDSDDNMHKHSGGTELGCGWGVIVIVAIMLIYFIFNGASFEAIDTLLGLGFLAFLFAKFIST